MNDQQWRDASIEDKLNWLRETVNQIVAHMDGPIRENFKELVSRVETLRRPKAVTLKEHGAEFDGVHSVTDSVNPTESAKS
jgi:hypothetical protein